MKLLLIVPLRALCTRYTLQQSTILACQHLIVRLACFDVNHHISFQIWKKNSPFLYDIVMSHTLEWPSLTVQWLPDMITDETKDYETHKFILGTHTTGGEQNYLMLAHVNLPKPETEIDARKYNEVCYII